MKSKKLKKQNKDLFKQIQEHTLVKEKKEKIAKKTEKKTKRLNNKLNKKNEKQKRIQKYEDKHKHNDVETYLSIIPPSYPDIHDDIIPEQLKEIRSKYGDQSIGKTYEDKLIDTVWFNNIKTFDDIIKNITKIYETQTHAFKINLSFGYVFETIVLEFGETYFIDYSLGFGHDDKTILEEPMYIGGKKDFQKLLNTVGLVDEEFFNQSNKIQNSKTKAIGIYQLFIKLYNTETPIGANVEFT